MATSNSANSSTDSYYFLPHTLPTHLPGLVSTNPADSPHMPLPQKALPPEVPGYTDLQPERVGTDFGMETSYKYVPNDYEVLKEMILATRLAPLTVGAGGTLPRYPEDAILQAIEYIQFQVGGVTIQELSGDELHFRQLVEDSPEEYSRKNNAQGITLTAAERAARAALVPDADHTAYGANGQWFFVEIPWWWTESSAKHWHQYAVQRNTRINIKWRAADYILQQDTANTKPTPAVGTTYIMEQYLRFRTSSLDTSVKDTYIDSVKRLGDSGLNYLVRYNQKQLGNTIAAGQTSVSIQLSNFNKPTYMLRAVIRNAADLQPNYMNNKRFATQEYTSYQSDASGHRMWPTMGLQFVKYMVNGREFLNNPETNVITILHNDYADVTQYPMGCIEYSKLTNPTLNINVPTSANVRNVDVFAYCYDYIRLVITTDNRSAVALEEPI